MSGYITTMFVPPAFHATPNPSLLCPPFTVKPEPLQPIFTLAHGQSRTNLEMHVLDCSEREQSSRLNTDADTDMLDAFPTPPAPPVPAKPQTAYTSPLQRIGEKLRKQQAAAEVQVPTYRSSVAARQPAALSDPATLLTSAQALVGDHVYGRQAPHPIHQNYSYKLVAGGRATRADHEVSMRPLSDSTQGSGGCSSFGAILIPAAEAQQTKHHNPFYGTTSLLDIHSSNPRTQRAPFKPQKSSRGTSSWQLKQYAEATLGSGSLRKAVKLPDGEDKDEWLAVNVVDFYNQINLLYGSITEFCSPQSCPEMKATDEFEYLWQDNEAFKKPTKMSAPEYIEHLMAWIQANVDNEANFPSRIGVPFPKSFAALIRNMFKRLYRVYAHIYCHHYPVIIELGLEPHLNTSFKHYVLFIDEHGLASGSKDFWGPLGDLVDSMLKSD